MRLDAALKAAQARHAKELKKSNGKHNGRIKHLNTPKDGKRSLRRKMSAPRMEQKVAEKETTETKKEVAASVASPRAPSQASQQKQFASIHKIIR